MTSRLLIVDDEPQIVRALTPAMAAAGFEVESSSAGEDALSRLASEPSDAVILDLGLPDMDGKDVIQRVREWSDVPIIVLSARDLENEKIAALDLGADDFVNKPVGVGELLARIRAAMRGRERRFSAQPKFQLGELEINFPARRVMVEGEEIRLTPREYQLLCILAERAGQVVTLKHHRRRLGHCVQGRRPVGARPDESAQTKVESNHVRPSRIVTIPGIGYTLLDEAVHTMSGKDS